MPILFVVVVVIHGMVTVFCIRHRILFPFLPPQDYYIHYCDSEHGDDGLPHVIVPSFLGKGCWDWWKDHRSFINFTI